MGSESEAGDGMRARHVAVVVLLVLACGRSANVPVVAVIPAGESVSTVVVTAVDGLYATTPRLVRVEAGVTPTTFALGILTCSSMAIESCQPLLDRSGHQALVPVSAAGGVYAFVLLDQATRVDGQDLMRMRFVRFQALTRALVPIRQPVGAGLKVSFRYFHASPNGLTSD